MQTLLLTALLLSPQTSEPDFAKTWASVESAIKTRYYARVDRKDELERNLAKWGAKAKVAKTKSEFSSAVNEMIDAFGDSHFDFFTEEDQGFFVMMGLLGDTSKKMANIDAWFKPAKDGYTIQMLMNGGAAEAAGLRKGDVITLIEGKPFTPIESLREFVGKDASISYLRKGKAMETKVSVDEDPGVNMFLNGTRRSRQIIERNGKKIGYFRLWTMAAEPFKQALESAVYGPLVNTDAMILDIRDGFGGRPEGYGDPFFRPEVNIEWKFGPNPPSKQLFGYQRPLVVLINEGSRSAKEVFSYIIKQSKRATLIGSRTAGHVLGTSPMPIENWAVLEIPMVEVRTDGNRLEGKGVEPDIQVPVEFDENGNDLVLNRGIEELLKKLGK